MARKAMMRRLRRTPAIKSILEYKADYLQMVRRLQETGQFLDLCVDIVSSLMSEVEFMAFARKNARISTPKARRDEPADRNAILRKVSLKFREELADPDEADAFTVVAMLEQMPVASQHCRDPLSIPGIKYLSENLKLNADEVLVIYVLFLITTPDMQWTVMHPNSMAEFTMIMSQISGLEVSRVRSIIRQSGTLVAANILELQADHFDLEADVHAALAGNMQLADFQAASFRTDTNEVFTLESFDIDLLDAQIVQGLLKVEGPCNILFKGRPGSGKTELARALIRAAGREIMEVPVKVEGSDRTRLGRLHYSTFFAANSVLLVDEAESILNTEGRHFGVQGTGTPTKAVLNMFFDRCHAKIIWIVNDSDDIHESALRRFQFKLAFDKLSHRQREQAIDLILGKHGQEQLKSQPFMKDIVNDEALTPGILDNVVRSYTQVTTAGVNLAAELLIPRLLMSHKNQFNSESGLSLGDERYQPEILNTSGSASSVVETAKAFYAQKAAAGGGLNVLLHGLPGTGKTEFVKYIARQTGRDLVFKRGSDLLSMWLGGTEKQIAGAFREAENRGAVLLVDEADTFFQPRESAQRSWEVSQTNEFLNQMENHKIMLFCCTNLIDRLDGAAMRRFHFKLEFRAMREDKRASFFVEYFRELLADLPQQDQLNQKLLRLTKLTPGDFRAVRQRFSYKTPGSILWQDLVTELEVEGAYKKESQGRAIGF